MMYAAGRKGGRQGDRTEQGKELAFTEATEPLPLPDPPPGPQGLDSAPRQGQLLLLRVGFGITVISPGQKLAEV